MQPTFTEAELLVLRAKLESWPVGNPYTQAIRDKLKRLGGQRRAPSPQDERKVQAEDLAVELAAMRHEAAVQPW